MPLSFYSYNFSTMGCPASVQLYAESLQKASQVMSLIHEELNRLNTKYSNYTPHSFVADINRSSGNPNGILVDDETAILLDYSQACTEISGGLFDITAGILFKAWDFNTPTPALPSKHLLDKLRARVGWDKVRWVRPHFVLPIPGMTIDFGGVVKEYAVDRAVSICYEHEIHHGIIELGGDLSVIGPKPDGSPWTVAVQNPFTPDRHLFTFSLAKGGVATSGDYARYIEIEGVRYCHIMNPLTGMPIKNVGSVTVVASPCLVAGSSSTIAFLMEEKGINWLKEQDVPFAFVGNDHSIAFSGMNLILDPNEAIDIAA